MAQNPFYSNTYIYILVIITLHSNKKVIPMFQSFSANIRVVDQEKSTHKAVLMGCPVNISTDLVALLFLLNELHS